MLQLCQRRILHQIDPESSKFRDFQAQIYIMSYYPKASFIKSANLPKQFVPDEGNEVAFAGRSNAGKSSAINTIVNRRGFAKTSKSPGRTQLVNFFVLRDSQRLVDLPGYGYAKVTGSMKDHWRSLMGSYFNERQSLSGLFIVVDIRRSLGDFDWQMVNWGSEVGCPVHILLSKADKLKRGSAKVALLQVEKELAGVASAQLFSSLKKDGVDESRAVLDRFMT
jgi:GTP-binding protein